MAEHELTGSADSVILIDFSVRRREGSRFQTEMYRGSLEQQYEKLSRRVPGDRRVPFEEFVRICFPAGLPKKYFISCPNFIRERETSPNGSTHFLHNLVIRPELTPAMQEILPPQQNIFLIGDIVEGAKIRSFQVKGFEYIDETMTSPSDFCFTGPAVTAVERKNITLKNGVSFMGADWQADHLDFSRSVFSHDNIDTLIRDCYTVKNPAEALSFYTSWMDYFRAREYYLDTLAKRSFRADEVTALTGFAVSQEAFRADPSLRDHLLDGNRQFMRNPILDTDEAGGDPVLIIRMSFRFNKKLVETPEGRNETIRAIRRMASGNVILTDRDPAAPEPETPDPRRKNYPKTIGIDARLSAVEQDVLPEEELSEAARQAEQRYLKGLRKLEEKYGRHSERKAAQDYIARELLPELLRQGADPRITNLFAQCCNDNDFFNSKWLSMAKKRIAAVWGGDLSEEDKKAVSGYREIFMSELRAFRSRFAANSRLSLNRETELLKAQTAAELEAARNRITDSHTLTELLIYLKPYDADNPERFAGIVSLAAACSFLSYDQRPDRTKLDRQKKAVDDFFRGYVKNPYLSTYLFSPGDLTRPSAVSDAKWQWYLDGRLNEKQQEAVRKSVESNGIFLLQGPPGTGKTQVIAEIVSQLVSRGRKVMISSETHKAIDNVFDRLPKIADIVPMRLIPDGRRKADNDYDPLKLVANFYLNICSSMNRAVRHFRNFNEMKDSFNQELDRLKLCRKRLEDARESYQRDLQEISRLEQTMGSLRIDFDRLQDEEKVLLRERERYVRTGNAIASGDFSCGNGARLRDLFIPGYAEAWRDRLKDITELPYLAPDHDRALETVENIDADTLNRELAMLSPDSDRVSLEVRRDELRKLKRACLDEYDEVIPEKEEEYERLQSEFRKITNELNAIKAREAESGGGGTGQSLLCRVFALDWIMKNRDRVATEIFRIRDYVREARRELRESLEAKTEPLMADIARVTAGKEKIQREISDCQIRINELNDSELFQSLQQEQISLTESIRRFFRDFNLAGEWNTPEEAFRQMESEWQALSDNARRKEAENREKIPLYEKITEYLSRPEVIREDTGEYTDELFESANVYGITCTSRENFRLSGRMNELLGMNRFNLKETGIDTVIIDEVSKSSFVDLLIPVLYGKTVILVGDHRQLNPMYDLAKMRPEEFQGLDPARFNIEMNRKFRDMYEISFFKRLFEEIRDDYKVMLNQQYRCHEDIMKVFNHFYRNELRLGYSGQNNNKQHNVTLSINGINIFRPGKSVYFINCHGLESRESQDATSFVNEEEAEVIAALINRLNEYFLKPENKSAEKLSLGVISTYGAQADRIKKSLNFKKLKGFRSDRDERPVVSTVDDFQGDERDIIFVSMVRNNRHEKGSPEFIRNYQRINVALSRARRMLVVAGNRDFLIRKGVIDLPDVYGRSEYDQKDFRVYEKIITTIEREGRLLDAADIIGRRSSDGGSGDRGSWGGRS